MSLIYYDSVANWWVYWCSSIGYRQEHKQAKVFISMKLKLLGVDHMGSVVKKRRKRMAKKKHKKLLKKTRIQRRNKK